MLTPKQLHKRRTVRTRYQLKRKSAASKNGIRPRLSVHRTGKYIYAQIIDDTASTTLVSSSSLSVEMRKKLKTGADKTAATAVGKQIAELAIKAGIKQVVFDRGGFIYAGRVKALAEAAREAGLEF